MVHNQPGMNGISLADLGRRESGAGYSHMTTLHFCLLPFTAICSKTIPQPSPATLIYSRSLPFVPKLYLNHLLAYLFIPVHCHLFQNYISTIACHTYLFPFTAICSKTISQPSPAIHIYSRSLPFVPKLYLNHRLPYLFIPVHCHLFQNYISTIACHAYLFPFTAICSKTIPQPSPLIYIDGPYICVILHFKQSHSLITKILKP